MKAILFVAILFFVKNTFAQTLDSLSTNQPSLISNADTVNKKIFICSPSRKSLAQPLIVVDGKVRDSIYLKNLDPNNIASINVLKGDAAVKKYGGKAITGVILIRTKKDPILQP
jgi:hypothetical protein